MPPECGRLNAAANLTLHRAAAQGQFPRATGLQRPEEESRQSIDEGRIFQQPRDFAKDIFAKIGSRISHFRRRSLASATAMSWSRFGSRLCLLETTVKLLLGVLPLARTPVPESVG
jgi:hypothetical protein